jgi:REP element-mobilizing transposase RayT
MSPDIYYCVFKMKQQQIVFRTHGGKRARAGRPAKDGRARRTHRRRPALSRHRPVHVTLRLRPGLRNLRTRDCYRELYRAFCHGCDKGRFRICHYTVQGNHLHLICEAESAEALSRGMQGASIRLARGINRVLGRKGAVFAGPYHAVQLSTPRQVRHAICYVLNNHRRHGEHYERPDVADFFSSACYFDGWAAPVELGIGLPGDGVPVAAPQTWLLATGWRRHGAIGVTEMPARGRGQRGPRILR